MCALNVKQLCMSQLWSKAVYIYKSLNVTETFLPVRSSRWLSHLKVHVRKEESQESPVGDTPQCACFWSANHWVHSEDVGPGRCCSRVRGGVRGALESGLRSAAPCNVSSLHTWSLPHRDLRPVSNFRAPDARARSSPRT